MKNVIRATALAAAALSLVSCGGGTTQPQLVGEIPTPNAKTAMVFDISWVDPTGHYYLADRTNKAIDMIDSTTLATTAVITGGATPFTGAALNPDGSANNAQSGPDGVVGTTGSLLYIGDVGAVKIVDTAQKATTQPIKINVPKTTTQTLYRVDEGCYDPDDKLLMYATPEEASGPFITWIDTTTNTVKAQYFYDLAVDPNYGGLEQCVYDSSTKSFYINNDATTTNPEGQVDVFLASAVVAATMTAPPAIAKSYPLGGCNPTGMALGPGKDLLIACTPDTGKALTSLILDRTTGSTVATLKLGGADQVAYDSVSNRYYMPLRFWVDSGVSIGTKAPGSSYNPILGIVDASSHAILYKLPAGRNCHSVAVDGAAHHVFVPHTSGASAFPNPGISVFSTQ